MNVLLQTPNDNDGTISGATWSTDVLPTSGENNALIFDRVHERGSGLQCEKGIWVTGFAPAPISSLTLSPSAAAF